MSYADFDRGITSQEINKRRLAEKAENTAREHLRRLKESEHVLNILRTIKPTQKAMGNEEVKRWLEITVQRQS